MVNYDTLTQSMIEVNVLIVSMRATIKRTLTDHGQVLKIKLTWSNNYRQSGSLSLLLLVSCSKRVNRETMIAWLVVSAPPRELTLSVHLQIQAYESSTVDKKVMIQAWSCRRT